MRRFLLKTGMILFGFLIIAFMINQYLFQRAHKAALSKRPTETLIAGASTFAIINEVYIENSLNLSQEADLYKTMYYKLLEVDKYCSLKNLVISVSEVQISHVMDFYLKGKDLSYETIKRNYPLTTPLQLGADRTRISTLLEVMYKYLFSINLDYLDTQPKFPFLNSNLEFKKEEEIEQISPIPVKEMEGYDKVTESWLSWHYYPDGTTKISDTSIKYLEKIIAYAQGNNIKIYMITLPMTSHYKIGIPDFYHKRFYQLIDELKSKENVYYLDYKDHFQDHENSQYFHDAIHLTKYGGVLISKDIAANILKNN